MKSTIELNESNFNEAALQSKQPVLVDFWAEWCGPCKMIGPVLEEVAREFEGRAVIGKVNVDANPKLAARFDIQGIPTLLYFSGGELRAQTVGVVGKKAIVSKLAELTSQPAPASAA